MKRKINLEVSSCSECPFMSYDASYSMSSDSGYNCKNGLKKHKPFGKTNDVDDRSIELVKAQQSAWDEAKTTLFPLEHDRPADIFDTMFKHLCTLDKTTS